MAEILLNSDIITLLAYNWIAASDNDKGCAELTARREMVKWVPESKEYQLLFAIANCIERLAHASR